MSEVSKNHARDIEEVMSEIYEDARNPCKNCLSPEKCKNFGTTNEKPLSSTLFFKRRRGITGTERETAQIHFFENFLKKTSKTKKYSNLNSEKLIQLEKILTSKEAVNFSVFDSRFIARQRLLLSGILKSARKFQEDEKSDLMENMVVKIFFMLDLVENLAAEEMVARRNLIQNCTTKIKSAS